MKKKLTKKQAYNRRYWREHHDELLEKRRAQYAKNRKRLRAYWQDWKAKNREHYLEWRRRWKKKNLEKVRETNRRWWNSISRAKKARRQKKHTPVSAR